MTRFPASTALPSDSARRVGPDLQLADIHAFVLNQIEGIAFGSFALHSDPNVQCHSGRNYSLFIGTERPTLNMNS